MEKSLTIGKNLQNEPVTLPLQSLRRHIVAIGASGSGKTVFGKCITEETARNKIPSILIDPQGDLASLIIPQEKTDPEKTDLKMLENFKR